MIIPVVNKSGTSYKARIELPNGQRPCKTFKSEREARRAEAKMYELRDGNNGNTLILGRTRTDDFFSKIFEPSKVSILSDSTRRSYRSHFDNHLKPIIGHKRLNSITPLDGDNIQAALQASGHKPKGINLIMRTARTMLGYAVERDFLFKNPFKVVKQIKEPRKMEDYWEAHEVKVFLTGIADHYLYPYFVTALNTGMRRGELASLKWKNVDFTRKRIKVVGTRDRYGDKELTKGKTDRTVPINQRLLETLQELKVRNNQSEYVFLRPDGTPVSVQHIYRLFDKLCDRVGIVHKIRFHDLRHTFASHFMMNGGNITQLALILGHTDQRVTQRYIHFAPDYLDSAARIVSF